MAKNEKTTTHLLGELKRLAERSGANLLKRIRIARQVLSDNAWIEKEHNGNWFMAHDALQNEFFGDVVLGGRFGRNGKITLQVLFNIQDRWPLQSDWEKYGYNVKAMAEMLKQEQNGDDDAPETKEVISWKRKYSEAEEEIEQLRLRVKYLENENQQLKEENRQLRQENADLRAENSSLKGELKGLRQPVGA